MHNLKKLVKGLLTLTFTTAAFAQQQAVQSDSFVDSVGVNIHLHNGGTLYYTNYPLIKQSLQTLGVRHVREGLIDTTWKGFYDRLNDLGAAGIHSLLITSPTQTQDLIQNYPNRVSQSFEGYESPNEYDTWPNWVNTLHNFEPELYSYAKSGARPDAPVVGPSLTQTSSYAALGNIDEDMDAGNLHNYYAGRNPGNTGWGAVDAQKHRYGSIPFTLDNLKVTSGAKPIWVTETGYTNQTSYVNYVSQAIAAVYMPRLLMEHWNAGVQRTYMYELLSSGGEDYGLMQSDGTPKPVFTAVSNLLNLLSDKGTPFTPDALNYKLSGGNSNLHQLLLEKRDGTFYLALWIEAQGWDPDKHVNQTVTAQNVTLTSPNTLSGVTVYQFTDSGAVNTSKVPDGSSLPLTVTDRLMIVAMKSGMSYQVQTSTLPAAGGTVHATPLTETLRAAAGTVVNFTATPNAGFKFTSFTGQLNSANSSESMAVNQDVNVTANFACTYSVDTSSLAALSNGSILPSTGGTVKVPYTSGSGCSALAVSTAPWLAGSASNGVLTLAAAANSGAARTATITLGDAKVSFTQNAAGTTYAILNGNVAGANVCVDGKSYLADWKLRWTIGDTHTVSGCGVQNIGGLPYIFTGFTSGLTGTADQTVKATAATEIYGVALTKATQLSLYAIGGGTATASFVHATYQGKMLYTPADTVVLTATPAKGCTFLGWGGSSKATTTQISVAMTADSNLTARFSCLK